MPTSSRSTSIRPSTPAESSSSAPYFTCRDSPQRAIRSSMTSPSRWPLSSAWTFGSPRRPDRNGGDHGVTRRSLPAGPVVAQSPWRVGHVGVHGDRRSPGPGGPGSAFGVPFLHVPASPDNRDEAEQRRLDLLRGNVDLVVLARYMQILSPRFLAEVGCRSSTSTTRSCPHSSAPRRIGAQKSGASSSVGRLPTT